MTISAAKVLSHSCHAMKDSIQQMSRELRKIRMNQPVLSSEKMRERLEANSSDYAAKLLDALTNGPKARSPEEAHGKPPQPSARKS